jgi:hypothetical protein
VDPISEGLMAIGIMYIILALALSYLFFKIYSLKRSAILLGLPFGFLVLAVSYIFLEVHHFFPYVLGFSGSLMWSRVVTQTWGFTLIAASYFLSSRSQMGSKQKFLAVTLWSLIAVICVFGLLLILNPAGLQTVYTVNELFSVVNLGLLIYIVAFLVRKIELANSGISGLISAPLAFAFLGVGEALFIIWNFDASVTALVVSQISRVIGLLLFIRIYYMTRKEMPTD